MKFFIIYILLMNLFTFCLFGIDKKRARQKKWRVPEKRLFLVALLGGSVGGFLGMIIFHHKIRKNKFLWGIPLIFVAQVILYLILKRQGIFF